jgi:GDPmannose 4,6-dehydratase
MCFLHIGVELEFKGKGTLEKGYIKSSNNSDYNLDIGKEVICVDEKYYRPTEVDLLIGDATKAKEKLGWEPKCDLKDLIDDMMSNDLKLMKKDEYLKKGGYTIKNYFE